MGEYDLSGEYGFCVDLYYGGRHTNRQINTQTGTSIP